MNQITDFNIKDKRVFIRADLNVPMHSGNISSKNRIQASLPTIKYALESGAKVMITSHLGRPQEGHFNQEDSLAPIADYLSQILNKAIPLIKDWTIKDFIVKSGEMVVLENCRFNVGENNNDIELSKISARFAYNFESSISLFFSPTLNLQFSSTTISPDLTINSLIVQSLISGIALFKI